MDTDVDLDQTPPNEGTEPQAHQHPDDALPDDELTPERLEAKNLRATVRAQDEKLSTFGSLIEELRARPTERIIERERPLERDAPLSADEQLRQEADLALQLGTAPGKVMNRLKEQAKREMRDEIMSEFGGAAADTVIDRFVQKAKGRDPVVADKVEEIFRKTIDELGPPAKAALLQTPADQRDRLLDKEWNAAAGEYLLPKARARVKPGNPTGGVGGGAGTMPERAPQAGEGFTAAQKDAMKRAGRTDKWIAEFEKSVKAGTA
jgi:hypothetical protein